MRPHPWDSPGKNTGVGCHFLLQYMKVKSESEVAQSCLTLRNPMDCSLPGSSVHEIFQARVLEWGATAFSRVIIGLNNSSLTIHSREIKTYVHPKPSTQNVHSSSLLLVRSSESRTTRMPTEGWMDRRMDKLNVIYLHNGVLCVRVWEVTWVISNSLRPRGL